MKNTPKLASVGLLVATGLFLGGCGGDGSVATEAASAGPGAPTTPATGEASSASGPPEIEIAGTAACQSEAQVIRLAEDAYATVNGGYAPLDELLGAGYFRAAPVNYTAVRLGTPTGGYTLVGAPGRCPDLPLVHP